MFDRCPPLYPNALLDLYRRQEYDRLSAQFLEIFEYFRTETYLELNNSAQYFINILVKNFLYLFTQPDYQLNDNDIIRFIQLNPTISNLVAISSFKTTDIYLQILQQQPKNFAKILTLYSARNQVKIDRKHIFDSNPRLACLWYSYFLDSYRSGLINPIVYQNLREHMDYQDDRLTDFYNISEIYLGATYINHDRDLQLKNQLNHTIQIFLTELASQINNHPNPKKLVVISAKWFAGHVVYRTIYPLLEPLVNDYELTLVHLGKVQESLELSLFKDVIYLQFENNNLDLKGLIDNDFIVAYYPDIGMNLESILLSNLRIAPIQISGVGHPISSGNSKIDYFVSGAEVEISEAQQFYGEKLILIPGLGAIHQPPNYKREGHQNDQKPKSNLDKRWLIINCPWMSSKINYALIKVIQEINRRAKKSIKFRFFSSGLLRHQNDFLPFKQDLELCLGEDRVELMPYARQPDYLAMLDEGDICIDAFHFAGSNTIADSLYLRQPTVTLEGDRWYNRVGAQLLRRVGLQELIAHTTEQYITLVLKLIHKDNYRAKIQKHLEKVNLNQTVFKSDSRYAFKQTIDNLIKDYSADILSQ